jgi:hypothetical protein
MDLYVLEEPLPFWHLNVVLQQSQELQIKMD